MNVIRSMQTGYVATPNDPTALATPASPRPTDTANHGAAKLSGRLLQTHGADSHDMQGHTGSEAA